MNTIQKYRTSGYRVQIEHYRMLPKGGYIPYSRKTKGTISNNGGFTVAKIIDVNGNIGKGIAACSKADQFCYKKGAKMAVERAANNLKNS